MKHLLKRTIGATSTALIAALAIASVALADTSLFGDATFVQPGNGSPTAVELASGDTTFSGIDFDLADGTTFADLESLGTDYIFTEGSCAGGSPRFQINVEDEDSGDTGNIFVYIGPPPNYTDCPQNVWVETGNLLSGTIDTSQLTGGTFYDPYAEALADFGDYVVTGIQLVADAGWAVEGDQVVLVDNVDIDGETFGLGNEPVNKDACKNGGWQELTRADDSTFKNQGDCIQYANTGK
jgi:hypothetical protein